MNECCMPFFLFWVYYKICSHRLRDSVFRVHHRSFQVAPLLQLLIEGAPPGCAMRRFWMVFFPSKIWEFHHQEWGKRWGIPSKKNIEAQLVGDSTIYCSFPKNLGWLVEMTNIFLGWVSTTNWTKMFTSCEDIRSLPYLIHQVTSMYLLFLCFKPQGGIIVPNNQPYCCQ